MYQCYVGKVRGLFGRLGGLLEHCENMRHNVPYAPEMDRTIPPLRGVEGYCRIPIQECAEPLVCIENDCSPGLIVRLQYNEAHIPGATDRCLVRRTVKELLVSASRLLPPGVHLMIWDAWRPASVQQVLFDREVRRVMSCYPNLSLEEVKRRVTTFVSAPTTGAECPSPHLTGGAVDVTLCDDNGESLYFGTYFDEFTAKADTRFLEEQLNEAREMSGEEYVALRNRRLLFHVMTACGFTNYPQEWWHYDYGNQFWGCISYRPYVPYGPVLTTEER